MSRDVRTGSTTNTTGLTIEKIAKARARSAEPGTAAPMIPNGTTSRTVAPIAWTASPAIATVIAGATTTMSEPAVRVDAPRVNTLRGPNLWAMTAARKMTSSDATLGVSLIVAAAESPAEKVASIGVTR